jgi:hypothetical protein
MGRDRLHPQLCLRLHSGSNVGLWFFMCLPRRWPPSACGDGRILEKEADASMPEGADLRRLGFLRGRRPGSKTRRIDARAGQFAA